MDDLRDFEDWYVRRRQAVESLSMAGRVQGYAGRGRSFTAVLSRETAVIATGRVRLGEAGPAPKSVETQVHIGRPVRHETFPDL